MRCCCLAAVQHDDGGKVLARTQFCRRIFSIIAKYRKAMYTPASPREIRAHRVYRCTSTTLIRIRNRREAKAIGGAAALEARFDAHAAVDIRRARAVRALVGAVARGAVMGTEAAHLLPL
jgi:hypothetical protein